MVGILVKKQPIRSKQFTMEHYLVSTGSKPSALGYSILVSAIIIGGLSDLV